MSCLIITPKLWKKDFSVDGKEDRFDALPSALQSGEACHV